MASRVREDEKNERIIRGLLKLPANRRCINCNSLGPQYVCTNFWTFICTNCSGIHREFTHRVKSISMAKFTSQEVSALQEGGNERAKEIYFKEWDPQHHSFPDNSNIDRLREFIKHVYVDRRYAGERSFDRPPRVKGDIEDSYLNRGSKSPPYDDTNGRSYGERPGSTSPAYNYRTSPGRFDRDDKSVHRNQEHNIVDQRFPDGPKIEERSQNQQKDVDASKSPVVQPVGGVINVPPAPIGDPAKPSGLQFPRTSAPVQNVASSSSRGSSIGNSVELKLVSSGSLIDFDADPVPPVAGAVNQSVPQQTASLPAESGGWASFDDSSQLKVTQVRPAVSTLESVLSQLSVPQTASAARTPSVSVAGINLFSNQTSSGQWPTMQQHQLSPLQAHNVQSSNLPFSTPVIGAPSNQVAPNSHGTTATLTGQSSQVVYKPLHEHTAGVSPESSFSEAKPSGRRELPADLFTMTYPSTLAPFSYYQTSQRYMGYGTQYPTAVALPAYSHSLTSSNPFAFVDEPKLVHASTFPNLAPLQGALPNVDGHSSILHTSSLPTQQWLPQQQILSAVPQSPYMVQQGASPIRQSPTIAMFPVTHQAIRGFSMEGASFNLPGSDQHLATRNYQPQPPSTFAPPGGNPFG
ncbi:unnamed protein product [Musa acuminata var. zebrina]